MTAAPMASRAAKAVRSITEYWLRGKEIRSPTVPSSPFRSAPEPGGSACCYWNRCGTQCDHPAQGLIQVCKNHHPQSRHELLGNDGLSGSTRACL